MITRVALEPAQRARFLGRFIDGPRPITIAEQGGKLVLRPVFEEAVELVPVAGDRVVQRDNGRELHVAESGALEARAPRQPSVPLVPLPASASHPLLELEAGRFDEAVKLWRERARSDPKAAGEEEGFANALGYRLMERDLPRAIEVLRLIATVFPDSSNAHDSLGEAYMKAGDTARAIAEYEQALRLFDADPRVPPPLRVEWRKHAEEQLAKLRAR